MPMNAFLLLDPTRPVDIKRVRDPDYAAMMDAEPKPRGRGGTKATASHRKSERRKMKSCSRMEKWLEMVVRRHSCSRSRLAFINDEMGGN